MTPMMREIMVSKYLFYDYFEFYFHFNNDENNNKCVYFISILTSVHNCITNSYDLKSSSFYHEVGILIRISYNDSPCSCSFLL